MLIDKFLPDYQIGKAHTIVINASVNEVYQAVSSLDMSKSLLISKLFQFRGLPQAALTLNGLQKIGFTMLGQNQNKELLLGLVGRFWTRSGNLQQIERATFTSFNKKGFAKAVWNFSMESLTKQRTILRTETRIYYLDKRSHMKFRLYWLVIGPFSSWIRKKSLKIIKRETEN